jgi:hypothetical protein
MLSDKLELNSVRALGRLELTSWEHIPGWAEIQPPLGKTCESKAGLWWRQGCCQHRWPLQLWGLEPGVSGRPVYLGRMRGKKGVLAKPLLTPIPSPGGTARSRTLTFKSLKWAKSSFQTPRASPSFNVTLGWQEGCFLRSCNSHGQEDGSNKLSG